ncbi:MAG: four helix bundle protein [Bacteroidota bacterium]|uniref:four helix bundle protein n=1 Tax=Runella sp. TaxID=1960881 RepID=UPI0030179728
MKAIELETRLIEFASRVIDMAEKMPKTFAAKHIGSQIIRSATSPALNYGEAQGAESKEDFVHKMKICLKELRETLICLKLIEQRGWFAQGKLSGLIKENNELVSIFVASAKTATKNPSISPPKSHLKS